MSVDCLSWEHIRLLGLSSLCSQATRCTAPAWVFSPLPTLIPSCASGSVPHVWPTQCGSSDGIFSKRSYRKTAGHSPASPGLHHSLGRNAPAMSWVAEWRGHVARTHTLHAALCVSRDGDPLTQVGPADEGSAADSWTANWWETLVPCRGSLPSPSIRQK